MNGEQGAKTHLLSDIRLWIAFFFLLRLVGITNAPLETGHNWRQALTLMIARNFEESDANIFYPRIDMAGSDSGIIGCEFPLYNYTIFITSSVFGYTHWYGRLINLIVSCIGIYFFYLLVRKISDGQIAFYSSLILLVSIWFAFSRKTMPDTFSVSLVMIGLYTGYNYLKEGKWIHLFFYFLFITLGALCKIPALSLVSCTVIIFFMKEIKPGRKFVFTGITLLSILIVSLWYFYWVPYLVETYHYPLYFPKGIIEGLIEIRKYIPGFFKQFYFQAFSSFIAFAFLAIGLLLVVPKINRYIKWSLCVVTCAFLFFVIKTGAVFPTHNYYIIPFVPVMAYIAGMGISTLPVRYRFIPLILICLEGIINQQHDFFIHKKDQYKLGLESLSDKYIGRNDLIVINGGPSPQEMYLAHRKGWNVENTSIDSVQLDGFRQGGAAFLIIDTHIFPDSISYLPLIGHDDSFNIYKLNPSR